MKLEAEKDLAVAVVAGDMGDDGIVVVLGPRLAAVVAVGEALREPRPLRVGRRSPRGGIYGHQRRLVAGLKSGRVLPIDDGRTGEDRAELIGANRVFKLPPMNEVVAHRMAPGHVAPLDAVGIVLKEEVILAAEEDEPIGVVEPVAASAEMELRAEQLVVGVAAGNIVRCKICAHGGGKNDY